MKVSSSLERFPANHRVSSEYPHRSSLDLNAAVVRSRRSASSTVETPQGTLAIFD